MVHEGLSLEYGATVKKRFPKPSQRPDSVPLERAKLEALQTQLPEKRANTAPDLPGLSLVWNSFGSLQSRTPRLGDTTCRIPWAQDQDRCFDCSNLLGLSPAGPATRGRVLCQWHLAVCHQQTVQISLLCGSGAGGTSLCLIELGMAGGSSYSQTANPNVGFVSTSLIHKWSHSQKSKAENFSYQVTLLDIRIGDGKSICSYSFAKYKPELKVATGASGNQV